MFARRLPATTTKFPARRRSSCRAYTDILRGRKDFAVLPAPCLGSRRSRAHPHGGRRLRRTSRRHAASVRSPNQITIVAHTPQVAEEVRSWLADVDRVVIADPRVRIARGRGTICLEHEQPVGRPTRAQRG